MKLATSEKSLKTLLEVERFPERIKKEPPKIFHQQLASKMMLKYAKTYFVNLYLHTKAFYTSLAVKNICFQTTRRRLQQSFITIIKQLLWTKSVFGK